MRKIQLPAGRLSPVFIFNLIVTEREEDRRGKARNKRGKRGWGGVSDRKWSSGRPDRIDEDGT